MANPNKSRLDASQCIVGAYDSVEESQRVSIVNSVEYAIELSADDGDSVISYHDTVIDGVLTVNSATNPPNLTSTPIACGKYSNCAVYSSITGGGVATPGYVNIEVSPSDAGNTAADWHVLSNNITAGNNPDNTISGTTGVSQSYSFCARRIRINVPTAGKPGAGKNVTYRLIMRS